jgi:hypothetical protein
VRSCILYTTGSDAVPGRSNRSRQSEVMNDELNEFHHRRRRIGARIQSHCLPRSFRAPHQRRQHRETRAGRSGTAQLSGQLRRQRTAQRHDQYHRPHHARPNRPSGSPTARGVGARSQPLGTPAAARPRRRPANPGGTHRSHARPPGRRAGGHAAARRQHRSVPG